MRSMLSVDTELDSIIERLSACIRGDHPVPLFIYTALEDYGVDINKLIQELERNIHGESDFEDSYWGC